MSVSTFVITSAALESLCLYCTEVVVEVVVIHSTVDQQEINVQLNNLFIIFWFVTIKSVVDVCSAPCSKPAFYRVEKGATAQLDCDIR